MTARFKMPLRHVTEGGEVRPAIDTVVSTQDTAGYRGTSLIRNRTLLGPYSRTMPMALWWP